MEAIRLLKKRPWGIAGAVIILLVILIGLFAPLLAPYGYNEMTMTDRLLPPSAEHVFGTDNLGRDILSRLLWGAWPYVFVGLESIGLALAGGLVFGALSAWLRGKTDRVLRAAVLTPALILGVFVLIFEVLNMPYIWFRYLFPMPVPYFLISPAPIYQSLFLPSVGGFTSHFLTVEIAVVFGLLFLPAFFRAWRGFFSPAEISGNAVGEHQRESRVAGLLSIGALTLAGIGIAVGMVIIVTVPLDMAGMGFPPPAPTWGNMISGVSRRYILEAPWMHTSPAIAITVAEVGLILFGLSIREVWLPRLAAPLAPIKPVNEVNRAGFWRRWLAALMDILIFAAAGLGILAGLQTVGSVWLTFGLSWGIAVVYIFLFWLWAGATPGKMIMGLQIVSSEGGELTFKHVFLRMTGYLLSILTLGIGFIFIAFDHNNRGLADRVAGTLVVRR